MPVIFTGKLIIPSQSCLFPIHVLRSKLSCLTSDFWNRRRKRWKWQWWKQQRRRQQWCWWWKRQRRQPIWCCNVLSFCCCCAGHRNFSLGGLECTFVKTSLNVFTMWASICVIIIMYTIGIKEEYGNVKGSVQYCWYQIAASCHFIFLAFF